MSKLKDLSEESLQALEGGYYQLQRDLAVANETIGNLQNELGKMQARIAVLEAQVQTKQAWINDAAGVLQSIRVFLQDDPPWMPLADDAQIVDSLDDTISVKVSGHGTQFKVTWQGFDYHEYGTLDYVTVDLPNGYALCREVQP